MTDKRKYWLTKAIAALDEAYDHLGEATSLMPTDERFDAVIDHHQETLYELRSNIQTLRSNDP